MTTLHGVLEAAMAGTHAPFASIALAGGRAHDRGLGVVELVPEQGTSGTGSTIISAGIHGNETAPLELLLALAAELDDGRLTVAAPTLLIVGHPASIVAGTRYIQTNLNRLFVRDVDGASDEHDRARVLMAAVDTFWAARSSDDAGLHLDLHTAIRASRYPRFVVEPTGRATTPAAVWQALAGADMQAVLFQSEDSWTFSHYSRYYHGAVAFTLELGRVAAFGDNDMMALAPMQRWLAARIAGAPAPTADPQAMVFFRVAEELVRTSEDFELVFADDVANFTAFATGTLLARDAETGDTVVKGEPLYVVFPNARVERGARAALLARPVAAPA